LIASPRTASGLVADPLSIVSASIFPATSSRALGVVVPIPTKPVAA